jgi:transposase
MTNTRSIQKVRFPVLFLLKGFPALSWRAWLQLVYIYIYSPSQVRPGLLTKGLGVLLLHDNAPTHSAAATVNLLNSWSWEILPHPPYSPDLAPSGFHIFPKMKKHLRGQLFNSNEDVQNEVKKWLRAQDFL